MHGVFFSIFPQLERALKREPENADPPPPPKRQQTQTTVDPMVSKGSMQKEFLTDVVKAFAACNIPMSKLDSGIASLL